MTNEITIQIGNAKRRVLAPASWDDLNDRDFLLFYSTLFTNPGDEFTQTGFTVVKLLSMAQHILRADTAMLAQWEAHCLRQDTEFGEAIFLDELRQVLHFCIGGLFDVVEDEQGNTSYATKLNRTRNVWPVLATPPPTSRLIGTGSPLKGRGGRPPKVVHLYAPADKLENLTIYELGAAFSLFEAFLQTNKEEYAFELLGTIYRPSRGQTKEERELGWKNNDRRMPYRNYEAQAKARAKWFKTLPNLTMRAILFWFAGCRQSIVEAYPKVFKKSGDGGKAGANYGWGGVLLSIAGGPVGLEAVADQHYSNALTYLSMKEDEAVEMERRMEEAKRKTKR